MSHTFKKGDNVRVASMAELRAINCYSAFVTATLDTVYVVDKVYNTGIIYFVGCEGGWFTHRFVLHEAKPKRDYVADHARRTLRKFGLTKEEAAAFVAEVQKNGGNNHSWETYERMRFSLSDLSRNVPAALGNEVVDRAFSWGGSSKGYDYWYSVNNRLKRAKYARRS